MGNLTEVNLPPESGATTLLKLLTSAGIGSRRKAAEIIKRGGVAVNGTTAEDFRQEVDAEYDHVTVDGKPVALARKAAVYLMLHKPAGVLSTTSDERGRATVLDIIPQNYRRSGLYPVGRLDRDSTGLLVLTNDGSLTHRMTHPRFEQEKEYVVQLDGALTPTEKRELEGGVALEEGVTSPARVRKANEPPYQYSITLHEGKKRQVRRMFAAVGYRVVALKRIRTGGLRLGSLKEGGIRELGAGEVNILRGDKGG
jgi:23S rRNA pseudouridine2605 synthase